MRSTKEKYARIVKTERNNNNCSYREHSYSYNISWYNDKFYIGKKWINKQCERGKEKK